MEGVMAASALYGLYQNSQAQNAQQDLIKKGVKMEDQIKGVQLEGLRELAGLAKTYNPKEETTAAIAGAGEATGKTLEQSLRNLRAQYAAGGADPGMTSKWNMDTNSTTRRVTDPFAQFALERSTGDTQRKMNAWSQAIGAAPGGFGDSYFKAASMSNPGSSQGSMLGLIQALRGLRVGKSGGSGDLRGGFDGASSDGVTGVPF